MSQRLCDPLREARVISRGRKQRFDQYVGAIDRSLGTLQQLLARDSVPLGGGHRAIDLSHGDPRAMVRREPLTAIRRRSEALGEIAARDRERSDELAGLHLRGKLGEWWRRFDHGAKRWMVLEWMRVVFF